MASSRIARRSAWIAIPLVLIVVLVALWNWDWFVPIVESRASAALGRKVTIQHLHVRLGRIVQVTVDGVVVANPPDWPKDDPPLADIRSLTVQADALGYILGHRLVLPMIGIDSPKMLVAETTKGDANFRLATGGGGGGSTKIGEVRISDGDAHIVMPKLKADFNTHIDTQGTGDDAKIVVDAKGTYAAQPITGRLVGGSLLSLRDAQHPWPIDLSVANGPTRVSLQGTIQDPLAFQGANVEVRIKGPDMGLLEPLVGFPIPKTPAYQIAGKLGLRGFNNIRLEDFQGRLGNSDIGGTIEEQPSGTVSHGKAKPVVKLDLKSNRVDLTDLSGFIGGTPGRTTKVDAASEQRETAAKARSTSKLLPTPRSTYPGSIGPISILIITGLTSRGRSVPLDDLTVALDVVDGRITIHPISFGVGKGRLIGNLDLTPMSEKNVHARMNIRMQNLDVSRMMAATHAFQGAGSISGVGAIDGTGDSFASIMGNGNGEVKMAMAGGNLSPCWSI